MKIPFNKATVIGKEKEYINKVIDSGALSGDGEFTKKCNQFMEKKFDAKKILLTTSCTHALDMAAILLDIKEGDQIILPSFTFSSTATAITLRGGTPIFIDCHKDTLNIDENLIEEAITDKTKAIFAVHYAGISCNMDKIMEIAKKHDLYVVEDAAQGVNSKYYDKYLGTIGDIGCYSFHATKNYVSGEGGAIIINNDKFIERAEIIREKGTDRSKFMRGQIDKYTWVDIGSSFLPSELNAAFLYGQLEKIDEILEIRKKIYFHYLDGLKELEKKGLFTLPVIPKNCESNYHLFYILLENNKIRNQLMDFLKKEGISTTFHYIPLHSSPMGKKYGSDKILPVTDNVSSRLLRLPFYNSLDVEEQEYVIEKIKEFFNLN